MGARVMTAVLFGCMSIGTTTFGAGQPALACAQIHDPRGDVRDFYHFNAAGTWDTRPLDVVAASVRTRHGMLQVAVQVDHINDRPAPSYTWAFGFALPRQQYDEWTWWYAQQFTGGDNFVVQWSYPISRTEAGPAFSETDHSEFKQVAGHIDPTRGVVTMSAPLSALRSWHLRPGSVLTQLTAFATISSGASAGDVGHPEVHQEIEQGGAGDDAAANATYRIGTSACRS